MKEDEILELVFVLYAIIKNFHNVHYYKNVYLIYHLFLNKKKVNSKFLNYSYFKIEYDNNKNNIKLQII